MEHILEKCLKEFEHIQRSQKGSIGTIDNVYLPQIDRKQLDELVEEIRVALYEKTAIRIKAANCT